MRFGHYIPAYNELINGSILAQTLTDAMWCGDNGHEYRFWAGHGCDLLVMRNAALDRAIKDGLDYLYMQDADVFSHAVGGPLKELVRTAEETGATMVGALVTMRTDPPRANSWPVMPGEVYECHKLGTGMVLINLNKVREWYDSYEGPCFSRVYETGKGLTPKVGSDIHFCYVIQQHGGTVVCDATIPTVHVNACHRHVYDGQNIPNAGVAAEAKVEPLNPLVAIGG